MADALARLSSPDRARKGAGFEGALGIVTDARPLIAVVAGTYSGTLTINTGAANPTLIRGGYDANGHGARVGIVLPPAATTVLDPSGSGAGQLRAPYLRTPGALEGEPWKNFADSFVAGDGR